LVAVDSLAALQIDSLNILLEFLTSTKEELKSIVTQLEEELQDKMLECKMVASCSTSPRDFRPTDRSRKLSVVERETKASTFQRNLSRETKKNQNGITEFSPFDETESESHEPGYVSLHLVDIVQTNEWFANFDDSDNRSDFHGVRSKPG
jgi:endoglucanase Acf2